MSSLTPDMVPTSTDQPKPTHTTYSDEDVVAGSSVVTDNIGRSEDLGDMSTLTPDIIATPANQPKPIQAANSDEGEVTGNSESGDDHGGERRRQAAAIKPGVTQTPLSSFLVPQTPEQRKKADDEFAELQKEATVTQQRRNETMGELLRSKGFFWLATSHVSIFSRDAGPNFQS